MRPWYKIYRLPKIKNDRELFCFEAFNIEILSEIKGDPRSLFYAVFGDSNLFNLVICDQENRDELSLCLSEELGGVDDFAYDISFLEGVTDNKAETAKDALLLKGMNAQVSSRHIYFIKKDQKFNERALGNPLVQKIIKSDKNTFFKTEQEALVSKLFEREILPQVSLFNLDLPLETLQKISDKSCLAFNQEELKVIQDFYFDQKNKNERIKKGLPISPTDVEIEIIAQTWSEHCKHKIFNAEIDYREESNQYNPCKKFGNLKIKSLFKTFIKQTTEDIIKERKIPWAKSLFSDNAGIVQYEENLFACLKVETHNSPSALDPYGGALTGILGVNRDILGAGLGAMPVANIDVFCLTPPSWPTPFEEQDLLSGICHPQQILSGVHKGVEDGGNKSGIPTINGSYFFDCDYAAKPLVFVGTLGLMPAKLQDNRLSHQKSINKGDLIVMAGGKIGRDGIHGATFSSQELNIQKQELSTVVQIGDPLTQKRLSDFILLARDQNLFRAVTDNGAGGLSSSVGELAELSQGARIDLEKCPLKALNLLPYEVVISESQERMTLAVSPESMPKLINLACDCGVLISAIGEFTDNQHFEIYLKGEPLASLPLSFLHSPPDLKLKAYWKGPSPRSLFRRGQQKNKLNINRPFLQEALSTIVLDPNVASKENWVTLYDHEVKAATVLKPFGGENHSANGAGGIWSYPHGGSENVIYLLGHGLAPLWSLLDPYLMAIRSVNEALCNIVAHGADPHCISILDNFCWPDPVSHPKNKEGEFQLGRLVRANQGLKEAAMAYGTPLISGKDSMKNDFVGKTQGGENIKRSILPTLLITALGKTSPAILNKGSFIKEGDLAVVISPYDNHQTLALSTLENHFQLPVGSSEWAHLKIDFKAHFKTFEVIYELLSQEVFSALCDVNQDGLLFNFAELLIGQKKGANINLKDNKIDLLNYFFASPLSTFVGTINPRYLSLLQTLCSKNNLRADFFAVCTDHYQLQYREEKIDLDKIECLYKNSFTRRTE